MPHRTRPNVSISLRALGSRAVVVNTCLRSMRHTRCAADSCALLLASYSHRPLPCVRAIELWSRRVDKYTIRACSHEMSKLPKIMMEHSAMRAYAQCQKKPICGVKFQPVGRPSKTSADGEESRHRWCIRIDRATRLEGPVHMIETLSSEKTNRHDERHEECHGVLVRLCNGLVRLGRTMRTRRTRR
jgi:hypothetical protein